MNKAFSENEKCKPFPDHNVLCKECDPKYHTCYTHPKWFCFGITTPESREKHGIPSEDYMRICMKQPPPKKRVELPVRLLNLSKTDVIELLRGINELAPNILKPMK